VRKSSVVIKTPTPSSASPATWRTNMHVPNLADYDLIEKDEICCVDCAEDETSDRDDD
jgi:hypothetical protein